VMRVDDPEGPFDEDRCFSLWTALNF
jgi:hypothetical protein